MQCDIILVSLLTRTVQGIATSYPHITLYSHIRTVRAYVTRLRCAADSEAHAREGAAASFDAFAPGGARELDLARVGDRLVAEALCRLARRGAGDELRRLRLGARGLAGGVARLDWPARHAAQGRFQHITGMRVHTCAGEGITAETHDTLSPCIRLT